MFLLVNTFLEKKRPFSQIHCHLIPHIEKWHLVLKKLLHKVKFGCILKTQ